MMDHPRHDFYADTFDTDDADGKNYLYNSKHPEKRYEVVSMLDRNGDEVTDSNEACGGVVKLGEQNFTTFMFN